MRVTRMLPELGPEPVSPVMPALAATRVRLATVAARYSWNSVLARPKQRDWRIPSWTSRANRCSTTTRRLRYSVKASLCCKAWACCNSVSWGCSRNVRPVPGPAATLGSHRARSTNRRIEPEETIGPIQMAVPFPRWQHGSGDIPRRTGAGARLQVNPEVVLGKMSPVGTPWRLGHQPASRVGEGLASLPPPYAASPKATFMRLPFRYPDSRANCRLRSNTSRTLSCSINPARNTCSVLLAKGLSSTWSRSPGLPPVVAEGRLFQRRSKSALALASASLTRS